MFDQLEKAANEERDRKEQAKRRERQGDVTTIQQMSNSMSPLYSYSLLFSLFDFFFFLGINSLPQAQVEVDFTREVIEQAKRELMEKYSLQMSDADARLKSLRSGISLVIYND